MRNRITAINLETTTPTRAKSGQSVSAHDEGYFVVFLYEKTKTAEVDCGRRLNTHTRALLQYVFNFHFRYYIIYFVYAFEDLRWYFIGILLITSQVIVHFLVFTFNLRLRSCIPVCTLSDCRWIRI